MEMGDDDDDDSIMPSTNKSFMICEIDVEQAKSQLDKIWDDAPENAPFINEEGDLAWGPVFLCDKMLMLKCLLSSLLYTPDLYLAVLETLFE